MEHFSLTGYTVQELLGFGASGEVWRALEHSSGQLVALKRLHGSFESLADRAGLSSEAEQLRREAALLASVRHEHIVRLRSVVPTSAGLVLVLDYAQGGSLAGLIAARGQLSAGEVVTVGAPLAQALADVHARGLVHGDVTPANILFTEQGKPLLADLGIASLSGERAPIRGVTLGFADPGQMFNGEAPGREIPGKEISDDEVEPVSGEISSGEIIGATSAGTTSISTRADDVYGLAAACFAALTGHAPYREGGQPALPLATLAPSTPPALVAAIESALLADPRQRLDAASFGRALFAACTPEPVRLVRDTGDSPAVVPQLTHRVRPQESRLSATAVEPKLARKRRYAERRGLLSRGVLIRRAAMVGVGAMLITGAVAGGVAWASHDSSIGSSISSSGVGTSSVGASSGDAGVNAGSDSSTASASSAGSTSGAAGTSSRPTASASASSAVSSSTDWNSIVAALDSRRDGAFTDADPGELDAVYTPQSPALVADRATLGTLVAAGEHAQGLALRLVSVSVRSTEAGEVSLLVNDVLPAYAIIGPSGETSRLAGRAQRSWLVVLRALQSVPASGSAISGPATSRSVTTGLASTEPVSTESWRIASISAG